MSFKECFFEFRESGLSLIYGRVGVGKTSLAEGVVWCLFGKTRKGVLADGIINNTLKKNCSVTLELKDGDNVYKITRYRKHDNIPSKKPLWLSTNGGKSISVDQEEINNIIGITYNLFIIANVITSSDDSSNILELKSQRNDIFQEIFGNANFEKYEKKISPNLKRVTVELETTSRKINDYRAQLSALKDSVGSFNNSKKEKVNELKKQLKELNDKKAKLSKFQIDKLSSNIKELEKISSLLTETVEQERELFSTIDKINSIIEKSKNTIESLNKKSDSYSNERCPECNQVVSANKSEKKKSEIASFIEAETKNISDSMKLIEKANAKFKKLADKKEALEKDKRSIETTISKFEFKNTESYNEALKNTDLNIETVSRFIKDIDFNDFIKEQNAKEKEIINALPGLEKIESELKEEQEYWQFWKDASDMKQPNNYKMWRIKSIIGDFNKILNDFMSILFRDDTVSDVKISFNSDLTETIMVDGEERQYALFSKGQRKKLNNSVNFTFFKMVRKFVKPIPFIFVDEAMDGLDNSSQYAMIDYLQAVAQNTSIYIISHNDAIKNSIDRSYCVEMKDGFSEINEAK